MSEVYKVFVGNLPYSMREEDLKAVVMQAGEYDESDIEEVIILKERSGDPSRPPRSRGIGFIAFTNEKAKNKALTDIAQIQVEYTVKGETKTRPIFLNDARPQQSRD